MLDLRSTATNHHQLPQTTNRRVVVDKVAEEMSEEREGEQGDEATAAERAAYIKEMTDGGWPAVCCDILHRIG